VARLLIFGLCPLPFENELKSFGPGVRTWQIAKPLAKDGHEVTLVTWRIPKAYTGSHPEVVDEVERRGGGAGIRRLTWPACRTSTCPPRWTNARLRRWNTLTC